MAIPAAPRPRHSFRLDGTEVDITFHPFTVADKRNLSAAMTFQDANSFVETVVGIVESCSDLAKHFPDPQLHFIERVFVEIYAKSTGGVIEAVYTCGAETKTTGDDGHVTTGVCGHQMPIRIPFEGTSIDFGATPKGGEQTVDLGDGLFVTLAVPGWKKMSEFAGQDGKTVDIGDDFVLAAVKSIVIGDKVYTGDDFSSEELKSWIEALDAPSAEKLAPFFSGLPVIKKEFEVTCPHCSSKRQIILQGLDDFFV